MKSFQTYPVVWSLIGVNVLVFLIFGPLFHEINPYFVYSDYNFTLNPASVFLYAFMHVSVLHLVMNMVALFVFREMEQIGHIKFLMLYVAYFLIAAFVSALISPPHTAMVGASGAIMGMIGFTTVLVFNMKKGRISMVVLIAVNAAFSFVPGVAWQAHLGGFLTGMVAGIIFVGYYKMRNKLEDKEIARIQAKYASNSTTANS